ncbi:MAG: FadR family transcriptional regulator [Deltaproteobacteria bacterium]|nr:FadR family transcriptional regulator [Deltaproteobacteria bacterium]
MEPKVTFLPTIQIRAFEDVAAQIRQVILGKRLQQGDRLPSERSLAEQFQVGRLTVREALRTLEANGLIRIKKGSSGGSFVGTADPGAVASIIRDNMVLEGLTSSQITEARLALELATVKSAIERATPEDIDRIRHDLKETRKIIGEASPGRAVSQMIRFHILVAEASHNLLFIMFVRALMEWAESRPILTQWVPTVEDQRYSQQAHERIFESINKRSLLSAQRLMKKHIERMADLLSPSGARG